MKKTFFTVKRIVIISVVIFLLVVINGGIFLATKGFSEPLVINIPPRIAKPVVVATAEAVAPTETSTDVPPTAMDTEVPATATEIPPTATDVPPTMTDTPVPPTATPTEVPPTATETPTATEVPATATVQSMPVKPGLTPSADKSVTADPPVFVQDISHDAWKIQGTDRLKDNPIVAGWLSRLKDPAPALWKVFPNVPNPDVPGFRVVNKTEVPDGMAYGTYASPYCSTHPCDVPVGAWEYRYISGDYQFLGTECKGDKIKGCMLVLINVMDQSYTWRDQDVNNGFTLRGRYFNGDVLEWGAWGLVSYESASMLNMTTFSHPGEVLNAKDSGNSGANCGIPSGCKSVDVTLVVHAGDAILAVAKTTVVKP